MENNNGWIKLHRKFINWEWYDDINTKILFLHLLLTVNHNIKKWRGNTISAGEKITSQLKLSKETGLSIKQIRLSINKLKETGEVAVKTNNKFSLFKLNNWEVYQQEGRQEDKPRADKGQQTRMNKNEKNILQTEVCGEFNSLEYLKTLLLDKKKHIQIIGKYALTAKLEFPNKKSVQDFIKRNVRTAQQLTNYSDEDIKITVEWLSEQTWMSEWKLETILKYINNPKIYEN